MWFLVSNFYKGAVAYLYQEGAVTGIMFCHQTNGTIPGWAYIKAGELITGICSMFSHSIYLYMHVGMKSFCDFCRQAVYKFVCRCTF